MNPRHRNVSSLSTLFWAICVVIESNVLVLFALLGLSQFLMPIVQRPFKPPKGASPSPFKQLHSRKHRIYSARYICTEHPLIVSWYKDTQYVDNCGVSNRPSVFIMLWYKTIPTWPIFIGQNCLPYKGPLLWNVSLNAQKCQFDHTKLDVGRWI